MIAEYTKGKKGIQSIEVGLKLIDALARMNGPKALGEIARAAGLSPSTTHRYMTSFIRTGMVNQDAATGRYDLGRMAVRVGLAALARIDATSYAANAARELVEETQLTVFSSVWGEQGPVIVSWIRGYNLVSTSIGIGSRLPLIRSATGHIFRAFLPEALTAAVLEEEIETSYRGARSAAARAELDKTVERVRRERFAMVKGKLIPGLRAAAAPILDCQGEVAVSLTMVGPDEPVIGRRTPAVLALKHKAQEASRELGFD